jgi:hypothetical protein
MAATLKVAKRARSNRAPPPRPIKNRKFMQTLSLETFKVLEAISETRGVSLQELLRARIIPDWLKAYKNETE